MDIIKNLASESLVNSGVKELSEIVINNKCKIVLVTKPKFKIFERKVFFIFSDSVVS